MSYSGSSFLVTGGAGSIGSAVVEEILKRYTPKVIRVFDNSDYGLAKLGRRLDRVMKDYAIDNHRYRLLLGNMTDYKRLEMAIKGVDYILHAAAIKDISVSEYNPIETIRTNVDGTINLIEACLREKPKKVLFVSSDKSVDFTSLYGATKFLGEQLTLWGHRTAYPDTIFSSIRFGNVIGARGNVFEIWREQLQNDEPLSVTDLAMKRYFWGMKDAVEFVLKSFELAKGGEIFIPANMEEKRLEDIIEREKKIGRKITIIGRRRGEKMFEKLMTDEEEAQATRVGDIWVVR